jgi:Na+/melibiose symporter-like transporter
MTSVLLLGMIGLSEIVLIALFLMVFTIPFVVAIWLLFEKANQEGWKSLIPIYNVYILIKIARKPTYWLLLLFIPFVNIIFTIWIWNRIAKAFGKDEVFTIGIILLGIIFIPILAFGSSTYNPTLLK